MARFKIDPEMMLLAGKIEQIAKIRIKDSFKWDDGYIYVIVESGNLWKAIGKNGQMAKEIQTKINNKIKIIEYSSNLQNFVKNIIYPLEVEEIEVKDNLVTIKDKNKKTKSLLIGRGGNNLKLINRAVKRFFNIEEIKVV
jgi:NusA-like KH domain protein